MTLDFGIAYSHADSGNKWKKTGKFDLPLYCKVVGSTDAFGFLGFSSEVWEGGYITFSANYDYIRFKKRFRDEWRKIGGGWSIYLTQCLLNNWEVTVGTDLRKPYKYYEASLQWNHKFMTWDISCGLYGSYTHGRIGIPNAAAAGLQFSIAWGTCIEGYYPSAWFKDLYPVEGHFTVTTTPQILLLG